MYKDNTKKRPRLFVNKSECHGETLASPSFKVCVRAGSVLVLGKRMKDEGDLISHVVFIVLPENTCF